MKSEDIRIARELKSRLSSLVELLDFKECVRINITSIKGAHTFIFDYASQSG
jgi:hypothetical protein